MSRKARWVHAICGTKVVPFVGSGGVSPYCPACGKIPLGEGSVILVRIRNGSRVHGDQRNEVFNQFKYGDG